MSLKQSQSILLLDNCRWHPVDVVKKEAGIEHKLRDYF